MKTSPSDILFERQLYERRCSLVALPFHSYPALAFTEMIFPAGLAFQVTWYGICKHPQMNEREQQRKMMMEWTKRMKRSQFLSTSSYLLQRNISREVSSARRFVCVFHSRN